MNTELPPLPPVPRPLVGISSCLLGEAVRFNGGHRRNTWIVDELGKWVDWFPICPETAMALGVPRSPLRLVGAPRASRLFMRTAPDGWKDLTDRAEKIADRLLLAAGDLDGFILKKGSPSCGKERVPVYDAHGVPARQGTGTFARKLAERTPATVTIEEGRLTDPPQRAAFLSRIFLSRILKDLPGTPEARRAFYHRFRLMILARAANGQLSLRGAIDDPEIFRKQLLEQVGAPLEPGKCAGILGLALRRICRHAKLKPEPLIVRQARAAIRDFRRGQLPLAVPTTLLRNLAEQHELRELQDQLFFDVYPYPLKPFGLL